MKYNLEIRDTIGDYHSFYVRDYLNRHEGEEVNVCICSRGGYVDAALEIYQAFKGHGNVHAHVVGYAASSATVIAMGCKTIDIAKNSLFLIHNASTQVFKWVSANKERLDQILKEFRKQRDDLATIDDVIANIYADRTGKPIDGIKATMTEGKWLKAEQAKALGLVDSIVDDKDANAQAQQVIDEARRRFTDCAYTDFGIPALPQDEAIHINYNNNTKTMDKTTLACILAILGYETLESKDDYVSLSKEDLTKIEDRLSHLEGDLKAANDAKAAAEQATADTRKKLDAATADIKAKEEEIANLKKAPGDQPDTTPDTHESDEVDYKANFELFNAVNS